MPTPQKKSLETTPSIIPFKDYDMSAVFGKANNFFNADELMTINRRKEGEIPTRVNWKKYKEETGNKGVGPEPRATNYTDLERTEALLDDRRWNLPQRLAILATGTQEMDSRGFKTKGKGGNGLLGYNKDRLTPKTLFDPNAQLDDLTKRNPNNWLRNTNGSIKLENAKHAYDTFWNTRDIDTAARALTLGNIRPKAAAEEDARARIALVLQNYLEPIYAMKSIIR